MNDAQIIFKYDLEHLSLDPRLSWMFEKSAQSYMLRDGHCIATILGPSVYS